MYARRLDLKDFSEILSGLTAQLKMRNELNERLIGILEKMVVAEKWVRIVAFVTGLIALDVVLGILNLI